MIFFIYKGFDKESGNWKDPRLEFFNIWGLEQSRSTELGVDVSNE